MSTDAFDPEILQDFLTESGELLDELEGDLVTLEERPDDPEMLNQIFRALHTIKGSASFLALTNLVDIAHAAESALNAARNQQVVVDKRAMDLLLDAVDTIKLQMSQIADGTELATPDADVVAALSKLGEGIQDLADEVAAATSHNTRTEPVSDEPKPTAALPAGVASRPLELPENKRDLLEFLLADLEDTLSQIDEQVPQLSEVSSRSEAAEHLIDLGESMCRSAEFFDFPEMGALAMLLRDAAAGTDAVPEEQFGWFQPRVVLITQLLREQTDQLSRDELWTRETDTLASRLRAILEGGDTEGAALSDGATPDDAWQADGLGARSADEPTTAEPEQPMQDAPGSLPEPADAAQPPAASAVDASRTAPPTSAKPASASTPAQAGAATAVEQTIRVEVGRLETLINLVGELVLQKNRVAALTRQIEATPSLDGDFREEVSIASGTLDRVTSDIQVAVMRTRMQPLDKLFGKYPRLIRDLAKKTGKQIRLAIEGGDTEVDKSIIEALGDPLVHLLRNSADHGLEGPDERTGSGKDAMGTIRIVASHQGSHVAIRIIDNGRGIPRDVIARKAVEKGLATEQEIAAKSDREVFRFILMPGFSTAEQVTDLSGRGVGMDVVRTNIESLKGSIEIDSARGEGTTITITIPLTVAIMPAMMVGIENETYAIPLSNLLEIVRPEECSVSTIHGNPVLRLRDTILPLLSAHKLFGLTQQHENEPEPPAPFAVILTHQDRAFGLLVSTLIGQQEIVIKPLDEIFDKQGPISGATVRDDGSVSLIVDVGQLARIAECKNAA
ncbi:MAG: chemotaxis protein CheA [Planctomycetota bacterium]